MIKQRMKADGAAYTATACTLGQWHMQTRAHMYLCIIQAYMLGPLLTRRGL